LAHIRPVHDRPPDEVILEELGPLDGIEVLNQQVLLAIYVRPSTRTVGGIHLAETVVDEDRYQSRVGMVLKLGPQAFKDDERVKFHGFTVKPGDWIVYRPSDGIRLQIGKRECRLIPDVHLKCRLSHPDQVF
jgi:co-chaperonin GroES (HSP10)